jgi:beta-glucanase (GH16 family)
MNSLFSYHKKPWNKSLPLLSASAFLLALTVPSIGQTPSDTSTNSAVNPVAPAVIVPPPAPAPAVATKHEPDPIPSAYVPNGYNEVFGDEFDEHSLDISKWWTRYIYSDGMLDHLNDEKERFRENNNHVMTGNSLQLTGRKVPGADPSQPAHYESGMIRSKMTFKYGYYEARLKMPPGRGMWPAFWLNADSTPEGKVGWPPEIDVFEFVNNGKEDLPTMFHMGAVAQRKKDGPPAAQGGDLISNDHAVKMMGGGGEYFGTVNYTDDYHVFGLLWDTDDTITWYVDGLELMKRKYKWVRNDGTDAPYAHILLNLSFGGQWAGRHGIDDSAFPQSLDIDYLRIYQKMGEEKTGQSTIGKDLYQPPSP